MVREGAELDMDEDMFVGHSNDGYTVFEGLGIFGGCRVQGLRFKLFVLVSCVDASQTSKWKNGRQLNFEELLRRYVVSVWVAFASTRIRVKCRNKLVFRVAYVQMANLRDERTHEYTHELEIFWGDSKQQNHTHKMVAGTTCDRTGTGCVSQLHSSMHACRCNHNWNLKQLQNS